MKHSDRPESAEGILEPVVVDHKTHSPRQGATPQHGFLGVLESKRVDLCGPDVKVHVHESDPTADLRSVEHPLERVSAQPLVLLGVRVSALEDEPGDQPEYEAHQVGQREESDQEVQEQRDRVPRAAVVCSQTGVPATDP